MHIYGFSWDTYRAATQMGEWNSLIFPGVFKKNSRPAVYMYIGDNQCKMRLRMQLKPTIRQYVEAILNWIICCARI